MYKIEEVMAGKIVTVTKRIDGSVHILYQGRSLKFRQIDIRPERPQKQKVKIRRGTTYISPQDHPWRMTYRKVASKINNPPLEAVA